MNEAGLKRELKLVILRHAGREQAVTGAEIARAFGFSDDRKIRQFIDELIDEEFPVCSATDAPAGYYFPATKEEAQECYRKWRHRGLEILVRARRMLKGTYLWHEQVKQLELV